MGKKVIKKIKTEDTLKYVLKGIEEKKGENIVVLNLTKIENAVAEYFVICQANSRTQVDSILHSIDDFVKKNTGENPWHVEGRENSEWILIDYVNVVAHIFQPDARHFYDLERLWADAEFKYIKS